VTASATTWHCFITIADYTKSRWHAFSIFGDNWQWQPSDATPQVPLNYGKLRENSWKTAPKEQRQQH
jgi:hypothetical protein